MGRGYWDLMNMRVTLNVRSENCFSVSNSLRLINLHALKQGKTPAQTSSKEISGCVTIINFQNYNYYK